MDQMAIMLRQKANPEVRLGACSMTPSDRQIVVAMIDGEFTLKRFRNANGRIFLEAACDSFAPIEMGEDQELTI